MLTRGSYRLEKQNTADITSELYKEILFKARQDILASGGGLERNERFIARSKSLDNGLSAEVGQKIVIIIRAGGIATTFSDTRGRST
jgi:hypothetical protein